MSLKEFNAKQFLLEKGEQVGLGVAVTLMVLMLIFSLFMPSKGFFSGSPKDKAEALEQGAKKLETDLRTRDIPENEKPESTEGRLTDLDINYLLPKNYEVLKMFQPDFRENPERRPPRILNIAEGVVADARVLLDTYMLSADFKSIWVFRDPRGSQGNAPIQGRNNNPFARLQGMPGGRGGMMGGMPGGRGGKMGRGAMPGSLPNVSGLTGVASNDRVEGLEPKLISVEQWNEQDLTARQPRPLRVVVIAGSFPYRQQLEEFRTKLHMQDIYEVLNETMQERETPSFEFRGVEIQRMEVDANGKPLGEWKEVKVTDDYRYWLKWTFLPFQEEKDPKTEYVKMNGLTAPLLREFHDKKVDPTMRMAGAMMGRGFGKNRMLQQPGIQPKDAAPTELKTHYPDVVEQLPKIKATIKKMTEGQFTNIVMPKTKPGEYNLDPFRPNAPPPTGGPELPTTASGKSNDSNAAQDSFIPEYVLVRAVDVNNLEPGKHYRYRLRIKMNNPNYKRSDVASPEYKEQETLTSQNWVEIKETVSFPPELHYYVVDEKKLLSDQEKRLISAMKRVIVPAAARMWAQLGPGTDQVAMQFHRWVEATPLRGQEMVPVGDWSVADRVFVSRGEYVGRKVRVDLPIWKYTRNAYILPAEDPKNNRERAMALTGIDVDFGFDNSEKEDTILIDFEGGRVSGLSKGLSDKGLSDDCRTEVLMLSPDGKLLARNSAKDMYDQERIDRRKEVLERIENIRAGKGAE